MRYYFIKRHRDDHGLSLIEVIVSMLILAIISVSLLSSFVLSARVQSKTKEKQCALTVAQNVMEGIKYAGAEVLAFSMNQVGGYHADQLVAGIQTPVYGSGYYEANSSFSFLNKEIASQKAHLSVTQSGGEYTYQVKADKISYYAINQIIEETKSFDVHITVDGTQYQGDGAILQNQFPLPEVSNLTLSETALINPEGTNISFVLNSNGTYQYNAADDSYSINTASTYYNDRAIQYFMDRNENCRNEKWIDECKAVQQDYEEACSNAIAAGKPTPTPYATPVPQAAATDSQIKERIVRETIITIEDSDADFSTSRYLVSASLRYKLNQSIDEYVKDSDSQKTYSGFYEETSFENLKNIYLFHQPLKASEYTQDMADRIIVRNLSAKTNTWTEGEKLSVFIAEQPIDNTFGASNLLYVSLGDSTVCDRTKFYYYNVNLPTRNLMSLDTLILNSQNYENVLVTDRNTSERIYEVTVQVFEHGSSEVLYETASTITR